MKRGTVLILIAAVAVLLWLNRERRRQVEELDESTPQPALFEGFRPERASVVRVDHLQRGVQVRMERDATGQWYLTEPIPYPAEGALLRMLLEHLAESRGVVDRDPDLAALTLDEPLAVLEVVEVVEEGKERTWRVEMGGMDLDDRLVNVRVPSHAHAPEGEDAAVLRVSRKLHTILERNPDDYRDVRATSLVGRSVVSVTRRGSVVLSGNELVSLDFDARRQGPANWRRTDPPSVRLDPRAIGWIAQGAAELKVFRFVDDSPTDLSRYWLDDPWFTIELQSDRGRVERLLFSCAKGPGVPAAPSARWYAMREGFPHVWEVKWSDIDLLVAPTGMLVDTRILQAHREDVLRVEFAGPERGLVLEIEDGNWWVTETRPGVDAARFPADPDAVEDLLATLEQAELGDCPQGSELAPAGDVRLAITSRTGEMFGGALGDPWQDPDTGGAGRIFRRAGDEMLQLLDEKVAVLWDLPLDDLRSLLLLDVGEFLVDRVRIRREGVTQLYYREGKEWFEATSRMTAPLDTQILIGDLLHQTAAEWLAASPGDEAVERIEVHLRGRFPEGERTVVLARNAAGEELFLAETGAAARLDSGLHARLLALFR